MPRKYPSFYEIMEYFAQQIPTDTSLDFINLFAYSTTDQPITKQWGCDQESAVKSSDERGSLHLLKYRQASNNYMLITMTSFSLQL